MKSANPLSGLIPWNWLLFCGLTCNRRQTEKENVDIILERDEDIYNSFNIIALDARQSIRILLVLDTEIRIN